MAIIEQDFIDSFLTKTVNWNDETRKFLALSMDDAGLDIYDVDQGDVSSDADFISDAICRLVGGENTDDINETAYTEKEKLHIIAQSEIAWSKLSENAQGNLDNPIMVTSAGSPGAGKTTQLGMEIKRMFGGEFPLYGGGYVYVDPDEQILMQMPQYEATLSAVRKECFENKPLQEVLERYNVDPENFARFVAYTKWRWASNYIAQSCLRDAFEGGYNLVYGTTATNPKVSLFFDKVAEERPIHVIMVDAPAEVKLEAAKLRRDRDGGKYVPMSDVTGKADALKDNLSYLFGISAGRDGTLILYDRDAADQPARAVGYWANQKTLDMRYGLTAVLARYGVTVPEVSKWINETSPETVPEISLRSLRHK